MGLTTDLIRYASGLTVTQERRAGGRLEVRRWQRRFIRGAFAPGVEMVALSVARGDGKTTLASGLGAAALDRPLSVSRAENSNGGNAKPPFHRDIIAPNTR